MLPRSQNERSKLLRCLVAAGALVAMLPSRSFADASVDPRVRYSIETVTPAIAGFDATIFPPVTVHFPPQILAENTSGNDVIVLDDSSMPMLKIGPGGTFANVASTKALAALDPSGGYQKLLKHVRGNLQWRRFSSDRKLTWYETRAQYGATGPKDPSVPARLKIFRIPLRFKSSSAEITGLISWSPILGTIVPESVAIDPPIKDVHALAQKGVTPALEVTNTSSKTLEILGSDGKLFATIGPPGIFENVNSPQYRDTKLLPPARADAVRLLHTQRGHTLVWLDRRLVAKDPPFEQQKKGSPIELNRWSIPAMLGGRRVVITGLNRWIPYAAVATARHRPTRSSRFPWPAVLIGIAIGAGAGLLGFARSKNRPGPIPDRPARTSG